MRVLFISSGMAPQFGGAAVSESSLCASLKGKVDLTIACPQGKLDENFAASFGLETVRTFSPFDFLKALLFRSGFWFQEIEGADVVHINGHWRWENTVLAILCRALRIPYVVHPRGMMLVGIRRVKAKKLFNFLLGNHFARGASRVIALSGYETHQFNPYRVASQKITVIPNGIVGLHQENIPAQTEVSSHFLYMGRLEERKNVLFLVEAFRNYVSDGGTAGLRFKGPAEHGYDRLLQEKIISCHLENKATIEAPSYGGEKWKHLGTALAVIYPCLDEAFGRVPFEAILAGSLPILPAESGGAEYLKDVLPGCIYKTHDAQSLAETLKRIEMMPRYLRAEQIKIAREWVENNLNWQPITEKVLELYLEVTHSKEFALSQA